MMGPWSARPILRGPIVPPKQVTLPCLGPVESIAWEEAEAAGITFAQILGKQRAQRYVKPRHQAMWRAARETLSSLLKLAACLAGATIPPSCTAFAKLRRRCPRRTRAQKKAW